MKRIKIAILGQGRSGADIHAAYLQHETDHFEVAAVADPIAARREQAMAFFGCDAYEDYAAIFDRNDIELVVNALPSHLHVPVTRQLLERGFHVLCEKPAARYAHEVDALIECAAKHKRMYAIFQQSRLALYFQKIVEVVNSGDLGRLIEVKIRFNGFARRWDWQTLQRFNGGSLLNTGPHPLDQALHLLQTDDLPHIYCRMERVNTYGDAEDFVKMILSAPDRPLIDLEISSCSAYPSSLYEIQGSRGGLRATSTSIDWRYFDESLAPAQILQFEPLQKPDGSPAYCSETLPWVEKHWQQDDADDTFVGATGRLYANLYAHLTTGEPLLITPRQVRQQIAVIEECHRQNPLPAMQPDL